MEPWIAITIGILFACGIFCLLRRSLTQLVIGILLLSQAANLLVFIAGGLTEKQPPIIDAASKVPTGPIADPLPQALVLTAIVIGFGLVSFTLALAHRAYKSVGDDINNFSQTDRL